MVEELIRLHLPKLDNPSPKVPSPPPRPRLPSLSPHFDPAHRYQACAVY